MWPASRCVCRHQHCETSSDHKTKPVWRDTDATVQLYFGHIYTRVQVSLPPKHTWIYTTHYHQHQQHLTGTESQVGVPLYLGSYSKSPSKLFPHHSPTLKAGLTHSSHSWALMMSLLNSRKFFLVVTRVVEQASDVIHWFYNITNRYTDFYDFIHLGSGRGGGGDEEWSMMDKIDKRWLDQDVYGH